MTVDIHGQLMELLRKRLAPFNVPNDIIRGIRDDVIFITTQVEAKNKRGAVVMTNEASQAGDNLRKGENILPESAKPKVI